MNTIVALVEFSDNTAPILEQCRKLGKAFDAEIVILHVVPKEAVVLDLGLISPTVLQEPTPKAIKADLISLLELRRSLLDCDVEATVEQLRDGPEEDILAAIDRHNPDLIIVGSHHRSSLYNWLIGSLTSEVIERARRPVLVVPMPAPSR